MPEVTLLVPNTAGGFPVDGVSTPTSPAAATPGTGFRQVFALGAGDGSSAFTKVFPDGSVCVTTGGASTLSMTAAGGVIKSTAGRLVRVLITTAGTAGVTLYDNASAASGTIIGYIPASAAAGSTQLFEMPAALGIYMPPTTNAPSFTVAFQ